MKSQSLKEMLIDTAETKAEVGPELHQAIMRAVRLARSHDKRTSRVWMIPNWMIPAWKIPDWMAPARTFPAWGAGVAVLTLAILYFVQTAPGIPSPEILVPEAPAIGIPVPSTSLVQTQKPAQAVSLSVLGDKLAALSGDTLLPEKELMEEFERLKSDLQRLGFRS